MTHLETVKSCCGCLACPVRSRSDWSTLPQREAMVIDRMKRPRRLPAGAVLFAQGRPNTGVYCIRRGLVGLRMTHENGTDALVGLGWAGQTLGARAFLRNSEHRTTAIALIETEVCTIERRDALRLTVEAPTAHMALVGRCLAAMDEAQAGLLENAALSNRHRLSILLLRLAYSGLPQVVAPLASGGVALSLPIARGDLAGMLGVQPETLSRIIARLRQEGLLRLRGRVIELPSLRALAGEAGLPDPLPMPGLARRTAAAGPGLAAGS